MDRIIFMCYHMFQPDAWRMWTERRNGSRARWRRKASVEESEKQNEMEETAKSDVTLELAVTWTDEVLAKFREVADEYTAETGVKFDIVAPGQEYESQLKVRMANNDLPDMWMTHGWSVIRYSEYMMDLSGENWASDVSDAAKA